MHKSFSQGIIKKGLTQDLKKQFKKRINAGLKGSHMWFICLTLGCMETFKYKIIYLTR